MPIKVNGTTSGSVTLAAPASGSDVTLTLPGSAGTAALTTDTGLAFITSSTFSAASAVNINNCFTSTYDNYRITLTLTAMSTDLSVRMRLRASGSDNSTTSYDSQILYNSSTTVAGAQNNGSSGNTQWSIWGAPSSTQPTAHSLNVDILGPQLTAYTKLSGNVMLYGADTLTYNALIGNLFKATTSFDGFSLLTSTGTISGTVRVYGYRNS